jgi:Fe-S-cluster-containing dehydrogenase component
VNLSRRRILVLLPTAAIAWKFVRAGTPEAAPNYNMSEHWWGMLIDIPKCIGCGNCVRACQAENDVPDGFFRTWVERYHVTDVNMTNPEVISPDGGKEGFPAATEDAGKYFFVPKLCNHCADSPCTQVCPVGATFVSPDGVVLVDQKYCLGCAYCVQACPYGCRYLHPEKRVADKCTLCYHRITKGLTTACCESCPTGASTRRFEKPQRSHPCIPEDPQRPRAQAADGHRRQGLLQRAGRIGEIEQPVASSR